jgi:23S rRNA (cytidine1920-2'-O)/16S rRNA (cytidine1409-2'-O)-methyltransferase
MSAEREPSTRLDLYCAEQGLSRSREKARREILAGWVRVNGETIRVPSKKVTGREEIVVERPGGRYASRGGYKLERGLDRFGIDVTGRIGLDMGASTGGFTDCLLQRGAFRVYAVDVGYGQFDYRLRNDRRVVLYERTNVRHLTPEHFHDTVDLVTGDLSFISMTKVYPVVARLFPGVEALLLVKPQFEAGPGEQKKGVVRDPEKLGRVLRRTVDELAGRGADITGLCASPVTGPKGNREFLVHMYAENGTAGKVPEAWIESAILEALEKSGRDGMAGL